FTQAARRCSTRRAASFAAASASGRLVNTSRVWVADIGGLGGRQGRHCPRLASGQNCRPSNAARSGGAFGGRGGTRCRSAALCAIGGGRARDASAIALGAGLYGGFGQGGAALLWPCAAR